MPRDTSLSDSFFPFRQGWYICCASWAISSKPHFLTKYDWNFSWSCFSYGDWSTGQWSSDFFSVSYDLIRSIETEKKSLKYSSFTVGVNLQLFLCVNPARYILLGSRTKRKISLVADISDYYF